MQGLICISHYMFYKHNMHIILHFKCVVYIPNLEEFVRKKVVKMFPLLPWQGTKYSSYICGSASQLYGIGA